MADSQAEQVQEFHCQRCAHSWEPRKALSGEEKPLRCGRCKSPYWDIPKPEARASMGKSSIKRPGKKK